MSRGGMNVGGEVGMKEKTGLRILSWNINGLRSLENFPEWLSRLDADVLCFQETKVTRDMLTEPLALVSGYSSYYSFSRGRAGYSGVATYVRTDCTPLAAEEGITGLLGVPDSVVGGTDQLSIEFSQEELKSLDGEGRCVITKHRIDSQSEEDYLVIFNLYCPRADPERADRKRFKLLFYKALDIRAQALIGQGNKVIILGDINTSHREIDHCDPYEEFHDHPGRRFLNHLLKQTYQEENSEATDRKAEHREIADEMEQEDWECSNLQIRNRQFLDSFRIFHPDRQLAFTCWNTKMNCRSTNYGTRIDYIFISLSLENLIRESEIHPDIEGSDHCPVSARFTFTLRGAGKPPSAATKYFKEFQGKQLSIKDMFSKAGKRELVRPDNNQNRVVAKKAKTGPAKITNFFVPKPAKISTASTLNSADVTTPAPVTVANQFSLSDKDNFHDASQSRRNGDSKAAWGKLFKPLAPNPLCAKHQEETLRRRVTKKGPNQGREFFVCCRGEGRVDDPNARCDFFKWAKLK